MEGGAPWIVESNTVRSRISRQMNVNVAKSKGADLVVGYALVSQVLLLVYYQVVEWINLFPWNEIRGGNGQETLDCVVGAIMLTLIILTWLRIRWGMMLAVLLYSVLLWLQITSWWLPYVRGASPSWQRVYGKFFGHTTKFLLTYGDHLAPDACHVVLQVLVIAAITTTLLAIYRPNDKRNGNKRDIREPGP